MREQSIVPAFFCLGLIMRCGISAASLGLRCVRETLPLIGRIKRSPSVMRMIRHQAIRRAVNPSRAAA
jgi:hypothetical protein